MQPSVIILPDPNSTSCSLLELDAHIVNKFILEFNICFASFSRV